MVLMSWAYDAQGFKKVPLDKGRAKVQGLI